MVTTYFHVAYINRYRDDTRRNIRHTPFVVRPHKIRPNLYTSSERKVVIVMFIAPSS